MEDLKLILILGDSMKIEIKSWTSAAEADVVEAFLVWQCRPISVRDDKFPGVLERPACCIVIDETVLVGFKGLLKYWEDNELWII